MTENEGLYLTGTVPLVFLGYFSAELVSQFCNGSTAGIVQGRFDLNGIFCNGDVLALFKHLSHDFGSSGCPASVFHQGDFAVLEVSLGQMIDKVTHAWVDACIVGDGGQYQLAVAESIGNSLCSVASCQIVDHYFSPFAFSSLASSSAASFVCP